MRWSKPYVWILAASQLIFMSCVARLFAQNPTQKPPERLVFSATQSTKGIEYKIDGLIVADPLRGFGTAMEKYGADIPVLCVIDNRLPILVVGNAVASAGKAGFKNVRPFVLDQKTNKISEIKLGPWTTMSAH